MKYFITIVIIAGCTLSLRPTEIFNFAHRRYQKLEEYQDRFTIKVNRFENKRQISYQITGKTFYKKPNLAIELEGLSDSLSEPILFAPRIFLTLEYLKFTTNGVYLGTRLEDGRMVYKLRTENNCYRIDWTIDCETGMVYRMIITVEDPTTSYHIDERYSVLLIKP